MTTKRQSLVWVRDEQTSSEQATVEFALDALFVYRCVTNIEDGIPKPTYSRAHHLDVLRQVRRWPQTEEEIWCPVDDFSPGGRL